MHRRTPLVIICLAIASGTSTAQENANAPPGVPPRFVTVSEAKKQQRELILATVTVRIVTEERVKIVNRNGKAEEVAYRVQKPVYENRTEIVDLGSADAYDSEGKKVNLDDVWQRATVGAAVVVSVVGKKLDPAYLKALAKDTLVIVSTQLAFAGNRRR